MTNSPTRLTSESIFPVSTLIEADSATFLGGSDALEDGLVLLGVALALASEALLLTLEFSKFLS